MAIETIHGQNYEYYSWEELGYYIFLLAKSIIESGEKFDRVVALARGGLAFSRSLVDYLEIEKISSWQWKSYVDIAKRGQLKIEQDLPVSVEGEAILLFDDVIDSGETMEKAKEDLETKKGANNVKTCGLVKKPWTKFQPDFCATETDSWVIFPNESRETIQLLVSKWRELGDSPEKIEAQLLQIGFPEYEVALFAKLD